MINQEMHMYKYVQTDTILYQHVSSVTQAIPSTAHNFIYLKGHESTTHTWWTTQTHPI
jgi:hypothetical protein